MKKVIRYCVFLFCSFMLMTCLEQIDLEQIGTEDLLVVDAMITDQAVRQQITLSRTVPLKVGADFNPESEANVWLEGDDNSRIGFQEISPGIYQTSFPFAAQLNINYELHIITLEGLEYKSKVATMNPTPSFDSLYVEFEPNPSPSNKSAGDFSFFVDSRSNPNQNKYFRWTWNSTYELSVPNPSRWLWTGGNNFVIRELGSVNDSLQVEVCWSSGTSKDIAIKELLEGESQVIRQPIHRFHSDSGYLKIRYSIEVKQYALSLESYQFWNLIKESTSPGFLFDTQVGTIRGNISNVNDENETVLGFFEVVQEQSERKFYTPQSFQKQGFRELSRFVIDCEDEEPIVKSVNQIGEFMEKNKTVYTLCYFITAPPSVAFCKIKCADCTRYGSNKRPDFW